MKFESRIKTLVTVFLTLLTLALTAAPAFSSADGQPDSGTAVVRMGFFEFGGMFEGAREGAKKSGYCYEYMMQVATYTGWNYQFVYGTYSELYDMLKNGEIDVLPYTNYNDERGREVLFSDKVLAEEEYYIAVKPDARITPDSLDGAVISTLEGADYNGLLLDYIAEKSSGMKVVYYPHLEETWNAVQSGEADATVFTSNAYSDENWNCIDSFGKKPTYIAVAKGRPELLAQLNEATALIDIDNPAYLGELYASFFLNNPMRRSLSPDEQLWMDRHPVLHVGGFVNDAPYFFTIDNGSGTATGLTVDVIDGIIDRLSLGITADYHGYNSLAEMEDALDSGEIDVIIPFYPSHYTAQQHNLVISNVVRVSNMELVFKRGLSYQDAIDRIATPATKLGIYYVQDTFPQSEVIGALSIQDAVDRVLRGEATGAVAQNVVLHNIKEKYDNLDYYVLPEGCGTCFAARPENFPLIRVLNRGLNYFSGSEISAIASQYTLEPNITLLAYFSSNKDAVVMLAVILIVLAVLVIALVHMNHLKRKADEASKAKTNFLFNMSHDIRTPMNAVSGFTNMAVKHIDDREKVLDCLDKTQKAVGMLLSLINNVLEVSRIESGNAALELQPGDIYYSFASIEHTLRELAETKDIALSFEFGEIRDRYIYADFDRCMRVFVNVISNAIKYTQEGGFVKVRCEQAEDEKDGYATFRYTVADNGIGMSEEFQKHVFDQFAREKNATISGIQGSGLGMSVVKSFVELMGGTVSVQSRQGEGSTFTILLPFRLQSEEEYTDPVTGSVMNASGSVHDEGTDFSGRKVLLVEDNELNREIAIDILEEKGLQVDEAEDGQKAVVILRERGADYYDFILMDIQMPLMNGYEATKEIRRMYPDSRIPIIALSANAFAEDKKASIAAGMDDHVAKPINMQELFGVLKKFL